MHPDTEQVYLVPVEECGNEFYLKLAPQDPKNVKAHFAVNYEGDKMIERIFIKTRIRMNM
jgi:hypothetical protein